MILFIFEGRKTEPSLFKTLEHLYFKNPNEQKICCFGYNIYELYRLMDETDNGKLYINYPMVESIRCTQKLPDEHFYEYKATREDCSNFKDYVSKVYSYYKSTDFIQFSLDKKTKELRPITKEREQLVKENWNYLKEQNIKKANYICNDINDYPENKSVVGQKSIFASQLEKFVLLKNEVSILNAFPLFLYDYFK